MNYTDSSGSFEPRQPKGSTALAPPLPYIRMSVPRAPWPFLSPGGLCAPGTGLRLIWLRADRPPGQAARNSRSGGNEKSACLEIERRDDLRLAVVVPYRDRAAHLKRFVPLLQKTLDRQGIRHRFYIVEQDDARPFNRGALLNAGALIAREHEDYCVFHDVDMVPEQADYRWASTPLSLVEQLRPEKQSRPHRHYPKYFGGVTLFDNGIFQRIDGYSNRYRGWGGEDDDLLMRLHFHGYRAAKDISGSYCLFEHDHARAAVGKPLWSLVRDEWLYLRNTQRYDRSRQDGRPGEGDGLERLQGLLRVRRRWNSGPCVHVQVRIPARI